MKGEELLDVMEKLDADLIMQVDEKKRRITWQTVTALVACVALAVSVAFGLTNLPKGGEKPTGGETPFVENTTADNVSISYLTLDVNPSIRIVVENGKVTGCVAINDDAQPILKNLRLTGCTIQEALPQVLKALAEQGYLTVEDKAQVLLLASYGGDDAEELLEIATQTAKETLVLQEISTYIVSQQVLDVETVKELAARYGVSEGKMQYVLNVLAEENESALENASSSTIVELFGMDIEKRLIEPRYKVGEYDEYGEKVLYAGWPEHMKGYIPWEKLPEEYRSELGELYSPADLAILSKPREWTTVPNVVGLPEAEARALMNSRNIAVRVIYHDDQGGQEGYCYYQDVPAGMRWNSDASIMIYISSSSEGEKQKDPMEYLGIEVVQ